MNFVEKKRNVHRFWKAIAINNVGFSLERNLIVDIKNWEFFELRADNFAQAAFLKYKISTKWPTWWHHENVGSYESYFHFTWDSFILSHTMFLELFEKLWFSKKNVSLFKHCWINIEASVNCSINCPLYIYFKNHAHKPCTLCDFL